MKLEIPIPISLSNNTKYYYRVGDGSGSYATGSFRSAPSGTAGNIKIIAFGDTRTNIGDYNTVCGGIIDEITGDPGFQSMVLLSGDLVASGTSESDWTHFFSNSYNNIGALQAQIPFMSCMGNHEGNGNLFKKYLPYNFQNDRYYSYDYGRSI